MPQPTAPTIPRNAAPGALEDVRAFVNTRNVESGEDKLATAQGLGEWLAGRGLPAAPASERDRRNAVALREALRALLMGHHDGRVPAAAVRSLNGVASQLGFTIGFDREGHAAAVPAGHGARAALARLLAAVLLAQAEGVFARLKACRAGTCQWAYYDWSRNHSGRWCDMAVCGNRLKAQRHRRRARRPRSGVPDK